MIPSKFTLDVYPIINEGSPTFTSRVINATRLTKALRIDLSLSRPQSLYRHRWRIKCSDAKPVVAIWYYTTQDAHGYSTTIPFDIIDRECLMTIGTDIKDTR